MNVDEALLGVTRLFLDSAPVICFVEKNPEYFDRAAEFFRRIDDENIVAVSSTVTLAECRVHPIRNGNAKLVDDFTEVLVSPPSVFVELDAAIGRHASRTPSSLRP